MEKLKLHFRRFEFKYILSKYTAEKIIPALTNHLKWDEYAQNQPDKKYLVNSLYFDSSGFGCYQEKMAGVKFRKKLRIRFYKNSPLAEENVFLEIKRKYDSVILKDRIPAPAGQIKPLLDAMDYKSLMVGFDKNYQSTLREFLWTKMHNSMIPQVMVSYYRKPLVSKYDDNFRVTFDSDLKAFSTNRLDLSVNGQAVDILPDLVIMELKYNNTLPDWFQDIIRSYQLMRKPYSKYCQSVENVYQYII